MNIPVCYYILLEVDIFLAYKNDLFKSWRKRQPKLFVCRSLWRRVQVVRFTCLRDTRNFVKVEMISKMMVIHVYQKRWKYSFFKWTNRSEWLTKRHQNDCRNDSEAVLFHFIKTFKLMQRSILWLTFFDGWRIVYKMLDYTNFQDLGILEKIHELIEGKLK